MWVHACYCGVGGVLYNFTFEREKTDAWSYCLFMCVLLLSDRYIDHGGDLVYVGI